MESLSTDNLMRLQVEQLEKEKKELNEKMRVLSKRLDHVERAYRKEERPLLAKDYELQQANDRVVFEVAQKARLEAHRQAHQQDIETKRRMTRMVTDFAQMKDAIGAKRGEEFAKRKELAQKKMSEEKERRRVTVLKAREEERQRLEEEERIQREQEQEEARLEAGLCSFSPCTLSVTLVLTFAACRAYRRGRAYRGGGGCCPGRRGTEEARGGGASRQRPQAEGGGAPAGNGGRPSAGRARGSGDAETGRAQGCRAGSRSADSCPCSGGIEHLAAVWRAFWTHWHRHPTQVRESCSRRRQVPSWSTRRWCWGWMACAGGCQGARWCRWGRYTCQACISGHAPAPAPARSRGGPQGQ